MPGLLSEIALVCMLLTAGPRVLGANASRWMALALWLNPAVILNGAALGYLDAQMAVPAVLSLIAVMAGRPGLSGVLAAAAVLTKMQALVLGPALLLALVQQRHVPVARAVTRSVTGAVITALLIVGPVVWHGAGPNMVQAVGRAAAHDMLSGLALNAWWLVTWADLGLLAISARHLPCGVGLCRRMDGAHLFHLERAGAREPSVPCGARICAGGGARRPLPRCVLDHLDPSALNMYLFYGLGHGWPPIIDRTWTGVDLSVVLTFLTCGLWLWLTVRPPVRSIQA